MSDYSQITNFTTKDGLPSGDPEKIILGSDVDAELAAIAVAIATKYDSTDIASNAQADALTSDAVLITPLKLARALANNTTASLQLANGSAATPALRAGGDTNTGLYWIGADNIGISTGGTLRFDVSTTLITSTLPSVGPAGSAAAPTWSFSGDPNTGVYDIAADNLGFSAGGVLRAGISAAGVAAVVPFLGPDGTAGAPAYSFTSDIDTGMYRVSANVLGFSTAGTVKWSIDGSGDLHAASTNGIYVDAGAAATPRFSFETDTNTGLYLAGADNLGITVGGVARLGISTTAITSTLPYYAPDGTAAAPSLTFNADTNTGFYSAAADSIGFTTAGANVATISATTFSVVPVMRVANGAVGSPAIGFTSDTDTGFYRVAADQFGITTAGTLRLTVTSGDIAATVPFNPGAGSAAAPSYIMNSDVNTGFYQSVADSIDVSVNAVRTANFNVTGFVMRAGVMLTTAGTAALPSFGFEADSNTGVYSVAADQLGISTGGTLRLTVSTTAFTGTLPWQGQNGSAATPAVSFSGDTNTGLYNIGADQLGFSEGGTGFYVGFRNIPQNTQAGNYTAVLADAGKHIYHASGAGAGDTYTIPANGSVAYEIGATLTFINNDSNSVSIAITTDTMTLAGTTSTGTRTLGQNGIATAVKTTSTTWLISGTALT